ncbi:MAG TPA: PKD domain-containing protein [Bacteroidia bacterium]|nr:PKD domain-containing protein [Bacteroidia bacterium]
MQLSAQTTRHVLFLGNSYTYVNNLPQLVANMAANTGDSVYYDSHTPGGFTLQQHLNDSTSINKIKAGGWDYIVLQEQSQLPSFPDYDGLSAIQLAYLINLYNPCARILFYMTWGRKNGDASNCAVYPPVCTYEGMDSLIYRSYMQMTASDYAEVSPVGRVWKYIRQNYPAIELYATDESHPSAAGSYAAACSFYCQLFKKDPVLLSYDFSLSSQEALDIRTAASRVVFDSLSSWDFIRRSAPVCNWNYIIGTGTNELIPLNFTTEDIDFYYWDFGDGTNSTLKSPGSHFYTQDGTYTVSLTVSYCDLDSTYQTTVQREITFCAHTPTIFPDTLVLCPNESDTLFTQTYDSYQWFDSNLNPIPGATNSYYLPTGGYPYSVQTTLNGCTELSSQVYVGSWLSMNIYMVMMDGISIEPDTACAGDTVALVLQPDKPPYPDENYIEWSLNGVPIPGSANDTLLVTTSGIYGVHLGHPVCSNYTVYENTSIPINFVQCTAGINDPENEDLISLYPNPAHNELHVAIPKEWIGTTYRLNDLLGRTLQSGILSDEKSTVSLEFIPKGVYVLKVGSKQFTSVRLIHN